MLQWGIAMDISGEDHAFEAVYDEFSWNVSRKVGTQIKSGDNAFAHDEPPFFSQVFRPDPPEVVKHERFSFPGPRVEHDVAGKPEKG